jgi:hypothetical protein
MTGPDRLLPGTECAIEQIGCFDRDVEQRSFSRRLVMRDRGLIKMAEVVQLVTSFAFQHPALRPGRFVRRLGRQRAGRVQIPVRLLRGGDLLNQPIDVRIELRIRFHRHRVRGAFDDLVDVGVVERELRVLLVRRRLPAQPGRGALKVVQACVLLALLKCERNRHRPIRLDARRPERVVQVNVGERNGLDRIIILRRLRRNANHGQRVRRHDVRCLRTDGEARFHRPERSVVDRTRFPPSGRRSAR